jgi:uncharacterized SAM-binding protein YcdF (DUF218 family)
VDRARVQVFTTALDTEDEMKLFKAIAGTNLCYIVSTSAHLPRAILLAQRHHLNARPAPASYFVEPPGEPFAPYKLFPDVGNLHNAERAIYQYLGLTWEWLRSF